MGKTLKFFKSLLGFKPDPKRHGWTLFKSSQKQHNHETYDQHQTVSRPSDAPFHPSNNYQTVVVAAANVVVAEDALPPPHGAKVEVVRNKSRKCDGYGLKARKALRALKALVNLKARVRGHILKKKVADDWRPLQAQAHAREKRLQFVDSPQSTTKRPPTPEKSEHVLRSRIVKHNQHSLIKSNGSIVFDEWSEGNIEIDTTKPKRQQTLFQPDQISYSHSQNLTTSPGSSIHPPSLSPRESYEATSHTAPLKYFSHVVDEQVSHYQTTQISPSLYAVSSKGHASMRTVPFTPAKSDSSRSCLSGYSDHPNYMLHTKSSRAKVRSLSAPGRRRRSKYSNVQQNDKHREAVGEPKMASYRGTQVSPEVVMVPESSEETDNRQSASSIQEKSTLLLREDESHDPEYSGPIFVLEDAIYMDDSPSPLKHMQKTPKDDYIQVIKDQWEMLDDVIPDTLIFGVSSEINRKKLQNIEHLIQKLTRLNSTHDEAHTDYIASLCENTKPDDRYISEILLASGLLLKDLGSSLTTFQFHSSGHPINPELFFVLEQTKLSDLPKQDPSNKKLFNKEKLHRKLIFDTVNEVLAKKLALVVPSLEIVSRKSCKVANNTLNGRKLLRDLCIEIEERLQVKKKKDASLDDEDDRLKTILWEEVLIPAESWTDYDGELSVIALEVERLIFEDLVNEVVLGKASHCKRIQPGRCRRRSSSK